MLFEMKNGRMKKGCARSNYFNPAKSIVEFYLGQSDFELYMKSKTHAWAHSVSFLGVTAVGSISAFADVDEAQVLGAMLGLDASAEITFYEGVVLQGVTFPIERYILVGPPDNCYLAKVRSAMSVSMSAFLWVQALPSEALQSDEYGCLSARLTRAVVNSREFCMLSLDDGLVTALWDYPDYKEPTVRRFMVKW